MSKLMTMKEEMKQLLNSEAWDNGNSVTARAVDKLRTEILQQERALRHSCRGSSTDSDECEKEYAYQPSEK